MTLHRPPRKSAAPVVVVVLATIVAITSSALAAAPQVRTQAPGFYRVILGDFEITALLDGTHPFPDAAVLMKPKPGASAERAKLFDDNPEEASALLAAADLKAPTEGSINAFLINTGTKLILIDSGAGTLYGACCGHLATSNYRVFSGVLRIVFSWDIARSGGAA